MPVLITIATKPSPRPLPFPPLPPIYQEAAERISREEHGSTRMLVIAGVGTRHYYRKMGYELEGPYMCKWLQGDVEMW